MNPVNYLLFDPNVECSNEYTTAVKFKYAVNIKLYLKTKTMFDILRYNFFSEFSAPLPMLRTRFNTKLLITVYQYEMFFHRFHCYINSTNSSGIAVPSTKTNSP